MKKILKLLLNQKMIFYQWVEFASYNVATLDLKSLRLLLYLYAALKQVVMEPHKKLWYKIKIMIVDDFWILFKFKGQWKLMGDGF